MAERLHPDFGYVSETGNRQALLPDGGYLFEAAEAVVASDLAGSAYASAAGSGTLTMTGPNRDLFANGIWTWFSDPRAVYHNGAYYIGVVQSDGDVVIIKHVVATGITTSFVLHAALEVDDHDNCAVFVRPDNGKILCVYTSHGDSVFRYRQSTSAEDITAWDAEQTRGTGAGVVTPVTYSNPRYLSAAGRLFNHYRGGAGGTNTQTYLIETQDYNTWSNNQRIIENTVSATPYVKSIGNGVDRIDFFFTSDHPDLAANSLYHCYAQWDSGTSALKWYNTAGVEQTLPITPAKATLVYDGSVTRCWIWDVTLDAGNPLALFAAYNSLTDHRYRFAKYASGAWSTVEIAAGGPYLYAGEEHYSGGICFDGNDPMHVYLSTKAALAQFEIQEWRSADSGATWAKHHDITIDSGANVNARPYSPRGHDSALPVLFWRGTYNSFISYSTDIFAGRSVDVSMAGAALSSSVAQGGLSVGAAPVDLSGAAQAGATAAAALIVEVPLSAAAVAAAVAAADLSVSGAAIALSGAAVSTVAASGTLVSAVPLAGAATGSVTAAGDLSIILPGALAGSAVAGASASGALDLAITLAGAAQAIAAGSGPLDVLVNGVQLAGSAAAVTQAAGSLTLAITLNGAAVAAAVAGATLSGGMPGTLPQIARWTVRGGRRAWIVSRSLAA